MDTEALVVRTARDSVADVARAVADAAVANQYSVVTMIDLREKMAGKGVEFDRDCMVVELCNPIYAARVLEQDILVSSVLPCRISISESDEACLIATVKPTAMLADFAIAVEMQEVAEQVENDLVAIMDAATT